MILDMTDPLHFLTHELTRMVAHVNEINLDVFKDSSRHNGLHSVPVLAGCTVGGK